MIAFIKHFSFWIPANSENPDEMSHISSKSTLFEKFKQSSETGISHN